MSSTRLKGKVLRPVVGRPMLALQVERLKCCRTIDQLVVATSLSAEDQPIAALCDSLRVNCYRGDLENVLDRFYRAADQYKPDHVVRLTGDCPLADPWIVDELVRFYLDNGFDYASNCRPPTLPDGLDAEVFTFSALETAWREAVDPFEREHVVPFIVRRPDRFRIGNWSWSEDLSAMRWTVDEPEDYTFISRVYESLYPKNPAFGFKEVLALLKEHPELANINSRFERNAGSKRK